MNDRLRNIATFTFLSSLLTLLCTGCGPDSFEINALPFQENEGDNWGFISPTERWRFLPEVLYANHRQWSTACSACRTKTDIINFMN